MKPIRILLALSPLVLLAAPAQHALAQCAGPELAGRWSGNDGGTYQIWTSGSQVSWRAGSGVPGHDWGKAWANNFKGSRTGNLITGQWWDVKAPWGKGTMTLRQSGDWTIVRVSSTGSGFGGTRWSRPRQGNGGCPDNVGKPVDE